MTLPPTANILGWYNILSAALPFWSGSGHFELQNQAYLSRLIDEDLENDKKYKTSIRFYTVITYD